MQLPDVAITKALLLKRLFSQQANLNYLPILQYMNNLKQHIRHNIWLATDGKLSNSFYSSEENKQTENSHWLGPLARVIKCFPKVLYKDRSTGRAHTSGLTSTIQVSTTQFLQFQLLQMCKTATLPGKQCHFTSSPLHDAILAKV